jgi:hypothetical protein
MALSLTLQPNLDQPASLLVFCGVVVTETIMNNHVNVSHFESCVLVPFLCVFIMNKSCAETQPHLFTANVHNSSHSFNG